MNAHEETYLTTARKDFIQRVMLNTFSIILGAAFASNFFTGFPWPVRITIWTAAAVVLIAGVHIKKKEK